MSDRQDVYLALFLLLGALVMIVGFWWAISRVVSGPILPGA